MRFLRTGFPRIAACAALGCLAAAAIPTTLHAQEPFPGLDAYVAKTMDVWKVPGLSIAIVRNDSVLYTKGYGVLAAAGKTPVNDQTLFEIGSSSKAFTATIVAMLVGDGKMRYDDRLTTYLPTFKLYDPVASAEVTIRDALSHRSGIGRGELAWLGAGISREEVLHRVRFLKPESPFRSRYSYQNIMFLAAGEAAGKAAGSSWDELVRQRIFVPLGMTASVTTTRGLTNKNVAVPHGMERESVYPKPFMSGDNIGPAGSIISNARDMAQWLRFQLSDGVYGGKRLVSSAAFRETHTPQIVMGGAQGSDTSRITVFSTYGMGWMVQDYRRQLMWQHGGNTDGMTAAVGMLPEQNFGVVVLSNMAGAQLPGLLMRYIFDRQLGVPMRDWSAESYTRFAAQRRRADSVATAQAAQRDPRSQPPLPLTAYAGTYADSLYGSLTISVEGDRLELRRGEWHGPLEYWNASNFRWTILPSAPLPNLFIKFEVTPENKVSGLYFGLGSDATLLDRKEQKPVARAAANPGQGAPAASPSGRQP
jgi:CubicO group peptidase (beta-lactamase class C family)